MNLTFKDVIEIEERNDFYQISSRISRTHINIVMKFRTFTNISFVFQPKVYKHNLTTDGFLLVLQHVSLMIAKYRLFPWKIWGYVFTLDEYSYHSGLEKIHFNFDRTSSAMSLALHGTNKLVFIMKNYAKLSYQLQLKPRKNSM